MNTQTKFRAYRFIKVKGDAHNRYPVISLLCEIDSQEHTIDFWWAICNQDKDVFSKDKARKILNQRYSEGNQSEYYIGSSYIRSLSIVDNFKLALDSLIEDDSLMRKIPKKASRNIKKLVGAVNTIEENNQINLIDSMLSGDVFDSISIIFRYFWLKTAVKYSSMRGWIPKI